MTERHFIELSFEEIGALHGAASVMLGQMPEYFKEKHRDSLESALLVLGEASGNPELAKLLQEQTTETIRKLP